MDDGRMLLEREYTDAQIDALIARLRDLEAHPIYRVLRRELRLRGEVATAQLTTVEPDKPGRVGQVQATLVTLRECENLIPEIIEQLVERKEARVLDQVRAMMEPQPHDWSDELLPGDDEEDVEERIGAV